MFAVAVGTVLESETLADAELNPSDAVTAYDVGFVGIGTFVSTKLPAASDRAVAVAGDVPTRAPTMSLPSAELVTEPLIMPVTGGGSTGASAMFTVTFGAALESETLAEPEMNPAFDAVTTYDVGFVGIGTFVITNLPAASVKAVAVIADVVSRAPATGSPVSRSVTSMVTLPVCPRAADQVEITKTTIKSGFVRKLIGSFRRTRLCRANTCQIPANKARLPDPPLRL
jgi:hypothetical protein